MGTHSEKTFTIKQFAKESGFTEEYIRQCCRSQPVGAKRNVAKLPPGYTAFKVDRKWRIAQTETVELGINEGLPARQNSLAIALQALDTVTKVIDSGSGEQLMSAKTAIVQSLEQISEMVLLEAARAAEAEKLAAVNSQTLYTEIARRWGNQSSEELLPQLESACLLASLFRENLLLEISIGTEGNAVLNEVKSNNPYLKEPILLGDIGSSFFVTHWLDRLRQASNRAAEPLRRPICVSCGKSLGTSQRTKPNNSRPSKYCSDDCRNSFDTWLKDVRTKPKRQWLRRISKRLSEKIHP